MHINNKAIKLNKMVEKHKYQKKAKKIRKYISYIVS